MAEVMVTQPKALTVDATVGAVRGMLEDDHVHLVLLVDGVVLRGTVSREDVPGWASADDRAMSWARLEGRTIEPQVPSEPLRLDMVRTRRRRLAVVDDQNTLLGLLCLKRLGHGFCSDDDVASRAEARRGVGRS